MGLLDTAKMIRKAQQARSQMSQLQVAGVSKSGNTAILVNGLSDIEEVEFNDELFETPEFQQNDKEGIKLLLSTEVTEAYKDAKKKLEKEMAENFDVNSLSDMFN